MRRRPRRALVLAAESWSITMSTAVSDAGDADETLCTSVGTGASLDTAFRWIAGGVEGCVVAFSGSSLSPVVAY
ncbi:hypothetical protein GR927_12045 [Mycolicibacterium sp. 3033]|nr:hypothetical protein [Mycolicibacterium aurantiacum]